MLKFNVTETVSVKSDLQQTNSREVLQYVTPIEQIENLALEAFQNQDRAFSSEQGKSKKKE